MPRAVTCPNCRKSVPWGPESPYRPFCSERCRLIDLGDWFEERQRIHGPPDDGADWAGNGDLGPDDDGDRDLDDDRYGAH